MQAIILLLLLWFAPNTADLQDNTRPALPANQLGVYLDTPVYSEDDLNLTLRAGVSILVLDSLQTSAITSVPEDVLIFYNIGIPYMLPSQADHEKGSVLHELSQKITSLPQDHLNRVSAFGLFNLPMETSSFQIFSDLVTDSLRFVTDKPFYYHTYNKGIKPSPAAFDFVIADFFAEQDSPDDFSAQLVYFHPSDDVRATLIKLEQVLNQSLQFEQSALILPHSWLSETIKEQPGITLMLQEFVKGSPVTLPLPANEGAAQPANGHLIIFWVFVGAFVVLVRYHPFIPLFAGRYLLNHTFFIQDIMEGRVRNLKSGVWFLVIQSMFTGLFFYSFMHNFYSDPGFAVIAHFISWSPWNSDPAFALAVTVVFISLLIHILSVTWLYLLIKDINQLYKAVNLYAWGFMGHIILTVILVGLSPFSLPWSAVCLLGGVFYVLWVLPFLIASFHGTKRIEKNKYAILFSTFGIYLVLAAAIPAILFGWDTLTEVLQLAYIVSG